MFVYAGSGRIQLADTNTHTQPANHWLRAAAVYTACNAGYKAFEQRRRRRRRRPPMRMREGYTDTHTRERDVSLFGRRRRRRSLFF